ncbi:CheY-P phosphatase CheC [Paenibacillus sp. J31TS4]|uniref:chemotaxis protein CheC n=1 Tax=Paenibacillus sp. J31TS4 TaxID=2807195 RepID=UPI001B1334ED|nr:chemotaxis protein CheC [Paenibacillus sp. J31TS4]GIP36834.1 CheY-P phosphatase CheC [Paenibacillus sp. J31TS4]
MSEVKQFEPFQMDVLKEVGNIGAGHAATALSKLLDKPIDMRVPTVRIVSFEEISDCLGGAEEIVVAVFLRAEGEAPGNLFLFFTIDSARRLLRQMAGLTAGGEEGFTEMELSALQEIGNILAGSYLTSLSELTRMTLTPSVPSLAIDMAGAILGYGVMEYGASGDHALLIDTSFLNGTEETAGRFFYIPDPTSFEAIFEALGVPTP